MYPDPDSTISTKPLWLFVSLTLLLALLHIAMLALWRPPPVVVPFPWVITMLNTIMIVIASSVAFLALGRYLVLRDPVSYWTGMGFAAFGVGFVFYLLAWPGLLPGGEPVVGHFSSTGSWIGLPVMSLLAGCLLAAERLPWPDRNALAGHRWLWSLIAWLGFVFLGGVATVALEARLPVLAEPNGSFTTTALVWGGVLTGIFGLGAILSARRYLRSGDILPGYVSFTQLVIAFALMMAVYGANRYGLAFFLDRFVVIGGFFIMQFGLLSDYVRLIRSEFVKSGELACALRAVEESQELLVLANTELEQRIAERTRHLEEQRSVLEQRNRELRESYGKLEDQTRETIRAIEEVHEKDRMLIQQSRMAAMGELVMNIAHQWRQPLNILALIIQEQAIQYRNGCAAREEMAASTRKAMEVIGHMSRTIDDFRNFYRPDRERVSFSVKTVLAQMIEMIDGSFTELQATIEVVNQDDLVLNGYPNEFSQVLLNILMNARDAFVEREVVGPCLVIRLFREGEKGVLTFTDNAGGIPEEIIDKIFDPYFTTKGPDRGTGIGLYMAKTLIEKNMGGSLTVRNTGGGAEFRIEVTLAPSAEGDEISA